MNRIELSPQAERSLEEIGLPNFAPYLMNRIMGRYNADLREQLAALGLTTPKMRALAVLSVRNGIQIGELAIFAVVEQSTLSRALDQLMADGLIRRMADASDNRVIRIFVTEEGRTCFERLWPTMAGAHEQMFEGVSTREREAFVGTLKKMLANVRQHDF